jgi:hypothetical protein
MAAPPPVPIAAGPPPVQTDVSLIQEHAPEPEPAVNILSPAIRARLRRKSSLAKRLILAILALAVAGGAVVGFIVFRERFAPGKDDGYTGPVEKFTGEVRNVKNIDEKAFQFLVPPKTWKLEGGIRNGLKGNAAAAAGLGIVALKRIDSGGEPDKSRAAWVAAAARDYGFKKPRDAELVKEGIERLESLFGENLELAEKPLPKALAGQNAQALEFKGTLKQVVWRGECYMLARHGIGYWFFIAAPTTEDAQKELEELQQDKRGFVLADERRGWREQPPKMAIFRADKMPLSVTAPEGVWEKKDPTEVDEKGVLLLFGRYLQEKDNRKNAQVLIAALDAQPTAKDALKSAIAYFEEERKKENKDYQFESIREDILKAGSREIHVAEIKVQLMAQPARYFLVAIVGGPANTIAILCDSAWENRQIWQQDFLDLLKTFQLRKE